MEPEVTARRPDPRLAGNWCGGGVAHDHEACGRLWDSSDPAEAEAAARCADDLGNKERETTAPPSHADVMSLVHQYALARIVENATVPTRTQREFPACVELHKRNCRESQRLSAALSEALTRAGLK